MNDIQGLIHQPRRMVFNWFGSEGHEPKAGDYMRAISSKRTWLVLSTRKVQVRVTKGETIRQSIEMVLWPDEIPCMSQVYRFHWNKREKKRTRKFSP